MAKDEIFPIDENDDDVVVTLDLDDGSELTCEILTIFDCGGDQDYIALLPIEENGTPIPEDDDTVYIYRYTEDENGTPILDNIADDEEYEIVSDRFDELLDEAEFDNMD
ncbi:MAG: DUF1292 domain-containing protein [Lachnospiraceae bacterium]|nr:DUF1292 domain-containing protein [Lachnospiraceae bacterium]